MIDAVFYGDVLDAAIDRLRTQRLLGYAELGKDLVAFLQSFRIVEALNAGAGEHFRQAGDAHQMRDFGYAVSAVRPGVSASRFEHTVLGDGELSRPHAIGLHEFF